MGVGRDFGVAILHPPAATIPYWGGDFGVATLTLHPPTLTCPDFTGRLDPQGHIHKNLTAATCKSKAEAAVARDILHLWVQERYGYSASDGEWPAETLLCMGALSLLLGGTGRVRAHMCAVPTHTWRLTGQYT
jgi:hypothetical protein